MSGQSGARRVVAVGDDHFVALSEDAYTLFEARRTGRALDDVARELSVRHGAPFSAEDVTAALARLDENLRAAPRERSRLHMFAVPLLRAPLVDRLARALTWLFAPLVVALVLAAATGCVVASIATGAWSARGAGVETWLLAYLLMLVTVVVHELGHAAACRSYGVRPSAIGMTLFFVFPALYSDVSGAWTLSRWQRVVVDLGGVYLQSIPLAVIAVLAITTHEAAFARAELLTLASIAFNVNPILRFDGYWALADALDVANLERHASALLARTFGRRTPGARQHAWPAWKTAAVLTYAALNAAAYAYVIVASVVFFVVRGPQTALQIVREVAGGAPDSATLAALLVSAMSLCAIAYGLSGTFRIAAARMTRRAR
jgi:putative peptide zinc metalloprotease protein